MGFQILNAERVALSINDLDREACAFWGVEYNDRKYARPKMEDGDVLDTNWFDCVGLYIHAQRRKDKPERDVEWCSVLGLMMGYLLLKKSSQEVAVSIDAYWQPFISLVRHWNDKKYTAVAIAD